MWLYKLTNKLNARAYIGTSVNPINQRINRHVYAAKCGRKDMAIASAIRKYGISNFLVECLGESDSYSELLSMEAAAIQEHKTLAPGGYNITEGGIGSRRPCSQETRSLISAKTKGRIPWNYGIGPTSRITNPRRASGKGGPAKGSKPWNFGKTLGPMPEEIKRSISEGVRRVRATKFWSTKRHFSNQEV